MVSRVPPLASCTGSRGGSVQISKCVQVAAQIIVLFASANRELALFYFQIFLQMRLFLTSLRLWNVSPNRLTKKNVSVLEKPHAVNLTPLNLEPLIPGKS